ncbi:hypothetical protein RCL1_004849 [Eukaryota sp. TZLM3-RCL]
MSILLTHIVRINDGLVLFASLEDSSGDIEKHKRDVRNLVANLNINDPPRCSIAYENYEFHYIVSETVCYLTLTDRSYPRPLAFAYLDEVKSVFEKEFGPQIMTAHRPYQFIAFDTTHSRIRKQYLDTTSAANLEKAKKNLDDVRRVMTRNINELLQRGEKFETLKSQTSSLANEAKKYRTESLKTLKTLIYRKYVPVAVIIGLLFLFWMMRRYVNRS